MDLFRVGTLVLVASSLQWFATAVTRGDINESVNCGSILVGFVALAWCAFRASARVPLALVVCAAAGSVWLALYTIPPLTDTGMLLYLAGTLGLLLAAWGIARATAWPTRAGLAACALVATYPISARPFSGGYAIGNWLALAGFAVLGVSAWAARRDDTMTTELAT